MEAAERRVADAAARKILDAEHEALMAEMYGDDPHDMLAGEWDSRSDVSEYYYDESGGGGDGDEAGEEGLPWDEAGGEGDAGAAAGRTRKKRKRKKSEKVITIFECVVCNKTFKVGECRF